MAELGTPPAEVTRFEIDATLRRTFLRILLIEVAMISCLYWMSRYFA